MRLTPLRLDRLEYDFEPPRARYFDHQCLKGTGKCQMPVVAIAAAIGTFAAGAAIATAAGATIGAMVVGGAMMVGAAMVVVGTVTNRPNLVRWGGYLSLAGGIGALGLGLAGGLTSGADAVQAGENVGTAAGGVTTDSGALGATADAIQAGENVGSVVEGSTTEGILNSGAPTAPPAPATQPTGLLNEPAGPPAPPPADAAPPLSNDATAQLAPKAPNTFTTSAPSQPNAFATQPPAAITDVSTAATPASGSGYFDQFGRWVKANPELARAGFQTVGGILKEVAPPSAYQQALTQESRNRAARMDPNSSWWRRQPAGG